MVVCLSSVLAIGLNEVGSFDLPRAIYAEIQVNGLLLKFKVVSGAEVSVVPSTLSGIPA